MPEAGSSSSTPCPVAPLAREAIMTLTKALLVEPDVELSNRLYDRLLELEDAAKRLRARSPLGALYLVLIAHGEIDVAGSWAPLGADLSALRAATCALEGAAAALRAPEADVLVRYYMGLTCDEVDLAA